MTFYISCTEEEAATRLETCKSCIHYAVREDIFTTRCVAAECDINLMIAFKDKPCPEGNW